MKFSKPIVLLLLFCLFFATFTYAAGNEKTIYVIVWNDFCIIVRTPSRQLTTMIGNAPLGIILKDKKTRITISNNYLVISVSQTKLKGIINHLRMKNKILLE